MYPSSRINRNATLETFLRGMETLVSSWRRQCRQGLETFLRGMETHDQKSSVRPERFLETFLRGMETKSDGVQE